MEIGRGSSPVHIHDQSPSPSRRRSQWGRQPSMSTPMGVPGSSRRVEAPRALPPPKYLHNLEAGHDDPGWLHSNPPSAASARFRDQSNVIASQFPKTWSKKGMADEEHLETRRRQSSTSTAKSSADSERRYDSRTDEGYYSISSSTSLNPQSVTFILLPLRVQSSCLARCS